MSSLDGLVARLKGEVFTPEDAGYARELAGFNRIARHRPDVVVVARSAEDVSTAVSFAAREGLPVGAQATGHGIAAPASGGVLVATRRMNAVAVDPLTRTAYVEAGAQWHQVISAAAPHGLAPLNGSSPLVGVVGYTLGGGLGPLGRQFGFAADHVTRIEVVTADGSVRQVTRDRYPELFWALRGGKGNFGIVTGLWFGLMPVRRLYGGGIYFPGERAAQLLRTWRQWTATVPEEMTSSVSLLRLPDVPDVPEFLRGTFAAHVRIAFTGLSGEGSGSSVRCAGAVRRWRTRSPRCRTRRWPTSTRIRRIRSLTTNATSSCGSWVPKPSTRSCGWPASARRAAT